MKEKKGIKKKSNIVKRHKKTTAPFKWKWLILSGTILVLLGFVVITDPRKNTPPIPYSQVAIPSPACLGSCINEQKLIGNNFSTNPLQSDEELKTDEKANFLQDILDYIMQLFFILFNLTSQSSTPATASKEFCTRELKQCPDGSYVERKTPTCEFEACPKSSTPTPASAKSFCTRELQQCEDGSYVGRKGPACEFEACPN